MFKENLQPDREGKWKRAPGRVSQGCLLPTDLDRFEFVALPGSTDRLKVLGLVDN